MSEKITNIQIEEFLKDWEKTSDTLILEEGKEKNEVVAIAKAKGINLKDNTDLAGFKTIYTFANKANANKARLPKERLLKALPSMIGKPVDIDHIRNYVTGHYIDYRYRAKEDMVIAYGVFYKSNFGDEWQKAKQLFKSKKLTTSYEIWCPSEKRKHLKDGTYELQHMEIAGGALLFNDKPAFEDAKVLELAKSNMKKQPEDLIFASKYNSEDLITSEDVFKKSVEENIKKLEEKNKLLEEEKVIQEIQNQTNKIKCSNCQEEFEYSGIETQVKCPKCFAILNKEGTMQYPPQIKDFNVLCPSCKVNQWLIVSQKDNVAKLRCLHCAKEYQITFKTKKNNELLDKIDFVYCGSVSCIQCGRSIYYSGISSIKERTLKCPKCGLSFAYTLIDETHKNITKIEEIKTDKTSKKEEKKMTDKIKKDEKTSEEKVEEKKVEPKKDETKTEVKETPKVEETPKKDEKVETPKEEKKDKAENAKVEDKVETEKKEVVVKPKEEKKVEDDKTKEKPEVEAKVETKETPKVEEKVETPKEEVEVKKEEAKAKPKEKKTSFKCSCVDCGHKMTSEKHCVNLKCPKCGGKMKRAERPGNGKPEEKKKEKPNKASEVKKEEKIEATAKVEPITEVNEEPKAEAKKEEKKVETKVKETSEGLKAEIEKLTSDLSTAKKEAEFYKTNALEIAKRREELDTFNEKISDKDILDDEKFVKVKTDKENASIKKPEVVGTKVKEKDYFAKYRQEIDDLANRKKKRTTN